MFNKESSLAFIRTNMVSESVFSGFVTCCMCFNIFINIPFENTFSISIFFQPVDISLNIFFPSLAELFFNEGTESQDSRRQQQGALSDPEESLEHALLCSPPSENIKPSFTKKLKFQSVLEGEPAAFRCKIIAYPAPTILWFHNNRQIHRGQRRRIHTESKMHLHSTCLIIDKIVDKDSGSYRVMAINPEGSDETTASLLVSLKEEQDANYLSRMRKSKNRERSSSLDSLSDPKAERTFRVDLRCVGSPFDKTSEEQRGRRRSKSAMFRTMYFRTSSPSKAPDKPSLETASERGRSPTPMFERQERFNDRYSDIYCDRGRDRLSDRFSDKLSDRCSDRYSDRFSDTDSLHGEVRAKLNLLQKAVKKKKRMSISTMSSSEFDLESVASEPSYADYAERLRVRPSTLPEVQHAIRAGDQAESKSSADFQSRLERITGLSSQSGESGPPRVRHSFQPQSRARAIQLMKGELKEQEVKIKGTHAEAVTLVEKDVTLQHDSQKEMEYDILVGEDRQSSEQWSEEAMIKEKEPYVLEWLEAGESAKQSYAAKETKISREDVAFTQSARTLTVKTAKEKFLSETVMERESQRMSERQLEQGAISGEGLHETTLESEVAEHEDKYGAVRHRKWQEDLLYDQQHTLSGRSKELDSQLKKPEEDLAGKEAEKETSPDSSRSPVKERRRSERLVKGDIHLSRENISELTSQSEQLVSEEEALTERIIKWQHGILTEQEGAVGDEHRKRMTDTQVAQRVISAEGIHEKTLEVTQQQGECPAVRPRIRQEDVQYGQQHMVEQVPDRSKDLSKLNKSKEYLPGTQVGTETVGELQLQGGISAKGIHKKTLESEVTECEDEYRAVRHRKLQEDVQYDQHHPISGRFKELDSEQYLTGKEAVKETSPERDVPHKKLPRSPGKDGKLSEFLSRSELQLSRENISELTSKTEEFVSEEAALADRIIKWQHDVLTEQEQGAVGVDPEWVETEKHHANSRKTAQASATQPAPSMQKTKSSGKTAKERFLADDSKDYQADPSLSQLQQGTLAHENNEKVRTESDYLVSEEEASAKRILKWQQDILSEQDEPVELESNWSMVEQSQAQIKKTEEDLGLVGATAGPTLQQKSPSPTTLTRQSPTRHAGASHSEFSNRMVKERTGFVVPSKEKISPTHQAMLPEEEMSTQKTLVEDKTTPHSGEGASQGDTKNKVVKDTAPVLTKKLVSMQVRKGEMAEFKCQFQGDPEPRVSWFRDDQPIIRDPDYDIRAKTNETTLTIYYPTNDHQGTFACVISNKYGKASCSCTLKVTDSDQPTTLPVTPKEVKVTDVSELSEEQMIEEELEFYMDTSKDGKSTLQVPQTVVHLTRTSDSSLHSSPVEIRITAPTPVPEMREDDKEETFEPIEMAPESPVDESTDQTVRHKFTFSFDVAGEAPHVVRELENISCTEGQTAVLECIITGDPAPVVTWFQDDLCLDLSLGKYTFEEHENIYRLYVKKIAYTDVGTYRCSASNKFGQVDSVADVSFDSLASDSRFSPFNVTEMTESSVASGTTLDISDVVKGKTLDSSMQVTEIVSEKVQQESQNVQESSKVRLTKQAASQQAPTITGCGLQASSADVKVSKLKQAFETQASSAALPEEPINQTESQFPLEDIPAVAIESKQFETELASNMGVDVSADELNAVSVTQQGKVSPSSAMSATVRKDTAQEILESSLEGAAFEAPSDAHHFVSLSNVTEVHQSPTLVRPQAVLATASNLQQRVEVSAAASADSAVEGLDGKGITGAFVRPGRSHLEMESHSIGQKQSAGMQEKQDHAVTESEELAHHSAVSQTISKGDEGQVDTTASLATYLISEGAQQRPSAVQASGVQRKDALPGASGVGALVEEEVTFSAVYDYYNPPEWARPMSPESEMSIEVGSTFSEDAVDLERFYTPASSTEISQLPKSPESLQTPSDSPGGFMTPPQYPYSPLELKRPPTGYSDTSFSPTRFCRSPDDEGIETTPPVFTIDDSNILHEGYSSLGIGTLQEKVQGIPPAFLKPLTKRRLYETETLLFCAEVFGLPSPEVKWFRNKSQLQSNDRIKIERDGDNISLEISSMTKADQGEYICYAVNYVGEAKSVALVVVISQEARLMPPPPAVTHQHVIEFDVEEDDDPSRTPSPQEILLEVELDENDVKEFERQVKIITIPEYTADNKSMIVSLDVLPSMYEEGAVDFISQESDDLKIAFEVTEMPPRFINPICDMETPETTTVVFECSLMGIPSPIVAWYKGNTKIPHDNKKYIHSSDGDNHFLKIVKVSTHDSGVYTCRAINVVGETLCRASLLVTNPQMFSGKTRGRELTAVSLGSAKVQPQKFDFVVGNTSFDGEQTSEIELEFEFQQDADESQKAVRLVAMTDDETSELGEKYVSINFDVFAEPSKDDKIEFKGKSTNTCSFHFQVTEMAPKCIIPLQNVTAAMGTPVMLQCLVSGKPNPTAEWFKDGAPVTNPRYIVQEKASGHFNLLITNVAQGDAGEFKCVIQNKTGYTETTSILKVF